MEFLKLLLIVLGFSSTTVSPININTIDQFDLLENSTQSTTISVDLDQKNISTEKSDSKLELNPQQLAQCLSEKGVVMYGAYWCAHCQKQKSLFGEENFEYVTYQECDDTGENGDAQKCINENINYYPTWRIPEQPQDLIGVLSLKDLAEISNCQ